MTGAWVRSVCLLNKALWLGKIIREEETILKYTIFHGEEGNILSKSGTYSIIAGNLYIK